MQIPMPIEIAKNIYTVGGHDQNEFLQCNPYLIIDGDEAVLIDPGSVLDFEAVYRNVTSLVPIENIKYVVLHHQDPDFCSSVPLFEKMGAKFQVVTHWRTKTLVKYYGITSPYYIVNKNKFRLKLSSGRELDFIQTPYLHFSGAIATYDRETKTLFSSDLFGAFSSKWSLEADESYMERMKAFHEHYMPSNEIIRPVMEVFHGMEIDLVAPQHGSLIRNDIKRYIVALRELECGAFLRPIRRDLAKSGGYKDVCSTILKRYASIYGHEEVLKVFEHHEVLLDDELNILDYDYTGGMLWNILFERIFAIKGLQGLIVLEPLVRQLANEYELSMPGLYDTGLKTVEESNLQLQEEIRLLKEINTRMQDSIEEAKRELTRDAQTGLYSYEFYKSFFSKEITLLVENPIHQNPGLVIMNVDNMENIKFSYGDLEVDEILKNIVYLLDDIKEDGDTLFRLHGAWFALYRQNTNKKALVLTAEKIRNRISISKKFVEKITASIGVVTFDEIKEEMGTAIYMDEIMHAVAVKRVNIARNNGKNSVCSSSIIRENENNQGNILIVDPDDANKEVLKGYIENFGYEIWTASNGDEALKLCEEHAMNLIITEVMLPQMDGFLFREKLISQSSTMNIPFIFLSYLKDEDSVKRAASLGVRYYYKKPYMISELTGIIDTIIRKKRG